MTQSLTERDRFITGLQVKLHETMASGGKLYTLYYEGKDNPLINAATIHSALRRALNSVSSMSGPTAFVDTPYRVSRTRETLKGSVRVYSGSIPAMTTTIADIEEDGCAAVILWRLFPTQQQAALNLLKKAQLNLFTVVVEDDTLKSVPAGDTRTVMPENRITPERAARMRALQPYILYNAWSGESLEQTPEIVDASASRAHCRLCGTVIQPRTPCVRFYQFTGPSSVRRPTTMYLHAFDCKQPEKILFMDTLKGYAVVTNDQGEPTEVKLLESKFCAETGQIVHKTLDINRVVE